MNNDHLDLDAGIYDGDGGAMALIEQQRAHMIEEIRTTKAVMVTIYDSKGNGLHWCVYIREDEEPVPFLFYAATKAARDFAMGLGLSNLDACALIKEALDIADEEREP